MKNFSLNQQFKITGIGSASGLIYKDNSLFIISDNSTFLYQFRTEGNELSRIPLLEDSQENIPKKEKSDFESISIKGNEIYLLGSGSKSKREKRITYNIETSTVTKKSVSELYGNLKKKASISDKDLNIEGALEFNEHWLLFQRGNGENSKNGIFKIKSFEIEGYSEFIEIKLPYIKEIETTFTDAILIDDKIYFLATAENSNSTYNDGEIFGTIIGRMNSETFEIEFTQQISDSHKFEGLTLFKNNKTDIEFLICEDNDTTILETMIYKLTLVFTK